LAVALVSGPKYVEATAARLLLFLLGSLRLTAAGAEPKNREV